MKLISLFFLASICICLQSVGSQKQPEQNSEEQILKLQTQVKQLWEYLKEMYVNSLSETEYLIKNEYLSRRRENNSFHVWYLETRSSHELAKHCSDGISKTVKDISLQVLKDFGEICGKCFNLAVGEFVGSFWNIREKWNLKSVVLNVTYVEQKQRDMVTKQGRMNYTFLSEDYNEVLELLATDLSTKLPPDTVSRIVSLLRIPYGNRTEIETALSYLYGSPTALESERQLILLT